MNFEMADKSYEHSRQRLYRVVLLLLVISPFVPEIAICVTAALARLKGCQPDQKDVCLIATLPASDVIGWALQMSAAFIIAVVRSSRKWLVYVTIAGWLVACYIVLIQGWARMLSLANENCRPNEGGVGDCIIFGGYVGDPNNSPAHDAVLMGWLAPSGALLSVGIFVIYAIVVIALGVVSAKRSITSA
jgi:hypothetical protein